MKQHAFSLVELSIVLVILGLLTGGILAGQSLIKAAQLRGISTEFSRYVTATASFRDKYFALPGDMNNATKFWLVDAGGCPGTASTAPTAGSRTCDGDGNGQIAASAVVANEIYRFWQHLANAGLIEGSFTGVPNDTASYNTFRPSITTPNVPTSRYPNAFWHPFYVGSAAVSDTGFFEGDYGNIMLIGGGTNGRSPLLLTEEAWNLDTKMDDGKPGTGRMTSAKNATQANSATGCSDTNYTTAVSIAASSQYLLTNTAAACTLQIKTGF